RPAGRNVTRLGEFQNAPVDRRIPVRIDAAARERYQMPGSGGVCGQVWSSCGCANDTRGQRLAAVEKLDVNPPVRQSLTCERRSHLFHEPVRPAKISSRLLRNTSLDDPRTRQVPGGIETLAYPLQRAWSAVTDITAAVREPGYEPADFQREWMMLPVT